MPATTERVSDVWQADRDTDAAVGGDDLEDDIEDRVIDRVALKLGCFRNGDEEHGEDDPPEIMGELGAELLPYEVGAGFARSSSRTTAGASGPGGEDTFECSEGGGALEGRGCGCWEV